MIVTATLWSGFFFLVCVLILLGIVAKRRSILKILVVAFFLRFALAVYFVLAAGGNYYDGDGLIFRAEEYSNMDLSVLFHSIPYTAYIYSWTIGLIWNIIGSADIMIVSLFNALLSFLCCVVAFDLSSKLFSKKTAAIIVTIVAIFPTILLQSAGFANRESLFILPFVASLYFAYRYYSQGKLSYLVVSVLLAILAAVVHTVGIVLFALILVISIKTTKGRYIHLLKIALPVLLVILMYILFASGIGTEKFYGEVSIEQVGNIQETRSVGRAAYLSGIQINSFGDAILYGPIKVIYFIMAPFVWMIRSLADIYGLLDGLCYAVLFIVIYKSGVFKSKNKDASPIGNILLIKYFSYALIAMMVVLAFGTSNYGTAMRHRAKLFIPLVIVAGVYIERRNNTRLSKVNNQ